jgi:UDP-N-acetylmuramoyl-tripeptide--D-alanyl-D-alanine ligase
VRFTAADAAAAAGGRLVGPDVVLDGAGFDTRSLREGQLFVALRAERDGHRFIGAAIAAGAPAYFTDGPIEASGTAVLVADTAAALLDLASWARHRLPDRVIAITGSVGKTSVKDLTAAVVSRRWATTANERSFNNEQGLPVTILGAPDDAQALVLEMGMRGLGEIARLCAVGRPTVGIVTNVGHAHTERVGGIDGVARAKGELIEALPDGGVAVLNADEPLVAAMAERTPARVLGFGRDAGEVRVTSLMLDELARPRFTLETPWGSVDVRLGVSGEHMALNAAAAAAGGLALDVSLDDVALGLESAVLSPMRMQRCRAASGALVLNDAYNANPTSMAAALRTLAALPQRRRRVAVLGVMAEIDDPIAAHHEIAALAGELGIELYAIGTDRYAVEPVPDLPSLMTAVGVLDERDAVLVKGSRVAGLEAAVDVLLADR